MDYVHTAAHPKAPTVESGKLTLDGVCGTVESTDAFLKSRGLQVWAVGHGGSPSLVIYRSVEDNKWAEEWALVLFDDTQTCIAGHGTNWTQAGIKAS